MSSLPTQGDTVPHAPFQMNDLENSGLHHLFVGHYDQPYEAVLYTYSGDPHAWSPGERVHRGAVVAVVSDHGTVNREWKPVASVPFHDLELDISCCLTSQDIQEKLRERLAKLEGVGRVTLIGEVAPELDVNLKELSEAGYAIDLSLRTGKLHHKWDLPTLSKEPTVRGQFVRDVLEEKMDPEKRTRILEAGLRALEGRPVLEVAS
jgi:hypothetical protein